MSAMLWKDVWWGEEPAARAVRLSLTPASWLYTAGWNIYLGVYKAGLKRPSRPHSPTLCVGNLVVGGSGKSPLVLALVRYLRQLGRKVVVGCSGYGSPAAESARIAPDGPLEAAEWGDEPAMFRWLTPDLPLVVGRNRVRAAELCEAHFPDHVLLMDDGFQHLPLKKDVSLLLDETEPRNTRCLPAGPYREPRANRSRASLVMPGRFVVNSTIKEFRGPDGLERPLSPGAVVRVVCALGQPERFLVALSGLGLKVDRPILRPDHDPLGAGNLFAGVRDDETIVATAKDWVKLRNRSDVAGRKFVVAIQETGVDPEAEFLAWIDGLLDEIASQTTGN